MAGERPPDNPRRGPFDPRDGKNNAGSNNQPNRPPNQPPGKPSGQQPYRPFPDREYNRSNRPPVNPPQPSFRPTVSPPPPPKDFFPSNEKPVAPPARPARPRKPKGAVASPARPSIKVGPIILFGLLFLFMGGILVGLFLFTRAASVFSGISVQRVDVNGQQIAGTNVNGNGKVNVLLLGIDSRKGDTADGVRSDTMILVSIDQSAKTANMISIPRDLWVDIPGMGKNRINAAYFFGDQKNPGVGGPPLAKLTVERNFGIQVHYFAQVDFEGFESVINAIGGITIDVKKPVIDAEYPTEDFGYKRVFIPAGIQQLDGKTALEYARSRHGDSDLSRNQRQQEVLLGVRERGVNLGLITNQQLSAALQKAIKTDLQWGDVLSLAQTAIGMDKANIKSYAIDANLTKGANIDGNDVLLPDWQSIGELMKKFNNAK